MFAPEDEKTEWMKLMDGSGSSALPGRVAWAEYLWTCICGAKQRRLVNVEL